MNINSSGAMPNRDLCGKDGGLAPSDLAQAAKYNLTVAQVYCFLPCTSAELSAGFLDRVKAGFGLLREHGIKALLRFLYDRDMPGECDYTFDTIYKHIGQLAPIVKVYKFLCLLPLPSYYKYAIISLLPQNE